MEEYTPSIIKRRACNALIHFSIASRDTAFQCGVLLVNPSSGDCIVLADLSVLEPEGDLLLRVLDGVRAVDDVLAKDNGIVASNGARGRLERVSSTDHGATLDDDILADPGHGYDWGGREEVAEVVEEGAGGEVVLWSVRKGMVRVGRYVS